MAIGWMYREDYAAAGIRLTPTLPDTRYAARSTVIQSLFYAVLMIPVSLWPFDLGITGYPYAVAAAILSPRLPLVHHPLCPHPPQPRRPPTPASTPAISSAPPSSIFLFSSPP